MLHIYGSSLVEVPFFEFTFINCANWSVQLVEIVFIKSPIEVKISINRIKLKWHNNQQITQPVKFGLVEVLLIWHFL